MCGIPHRRSPRRPQCSCAAPGERAPPCLIGPAWIHSRMGRLSIQFSSSGSRSRRTDHFGISPQPFDFVSLGVRCFHRLPMRSEATVDPHPRAPARLDLACNSRPVIGESRRQAWLSEPALGQFSPSAPTSRTGRSNLEDRESAGPATSRRLSSPRPDLRASAAAGSRVVEPQKPAGYASARSLRRTWLFQRVD